MIDPHSDTSIASLESLNTDIECISAVTKGDIYPQTEELFKLIIVSIINILNRNLNENLLDRRLEREIKYEEVLRSIDRFKRSNEFFVTVENYIGLGLSHLYQRFASLNKYFSFRRESEIFEFLVEKASLIFFVEQAYGKIREYFPSAKLFLEVFTDPETDEGKELVIFIQTDLHPDEVFNKLELLDDNWWLDASFDIGENLSVHVEFK